MLVRRTGRSFGGVAPSVAPQGTPTSGPPLLGCLACDPEPGCDLSPRITGYAEPGDGLADYLVQLGGQAGHVGQGVNVTACDPAGVGAQNAAGECGVLVVSPRAAVRSGQAADGRSAGPEAPVDGWSVMTGLTGRRPCGRSARRVTGDR
jgi:hypothetical protein